MDVLGLFGPIIGITLVSFRVVAFWMAFPFVMSLNIPATVRIACALTLSLALFPLVEPQLPMWTVTNPPALLSLLRLERERSSLGLSLIHK